MCRRRSSEEDDDKETDDVHRRMFINIFHTLPMRHAVCIPSRLSRGAFSMHRLCHQSQGSRERGSAFAEYSMIAAALVVTTLAAIGIFRGAVVADHKARSQTQPFAQSTRPLLFDGTASPHVGSKH